MPCSGCNKKTTTDGGMVRDRFCVRCLWFWVAIGVVAFIALYHYHGSNGGVHIG